MTGTPPGDGREGLPRTRLLPTAELENRGRYQLLTSLVVPRPIGWVSSRSPAGIANLAPFSYFVALSATPMLVAVSIGSRRGSPKDTLTNIRDSGVFCVNIVTEKHLGAMNESSGEHPPDVDEFAVAGVEAAEGEMVAAPYVADCPAVFECTLHKEVELGSESNVLVIGKVVGVRLEDSIEFTPGTYLVDPAHLRPVARLGGETYAFLGQISSLGRPDIAPSA
ncbi:MAG TPA: flavin reductase family protein [Longimicrobiaceae bacterium]|nr:flavin reductase family protein [Longimicrobiaceae bacterium]